MSERFTLYKGYMQGESWKTLRRKLMVARNWTCESCQATKNLVGHHMVYRTPLEAGTLDDLMCLCSDCHDILHRGCKTSEDVPEHREYTVALIAILREKEKASGRIPKKKQAQTSPTKESVMSSNLGVLRSKYRKATATKKKTFRRSQILETIKTLQALYDSTETLVLHPSRQ